MFNISNRIYCPDNTPIQFGVHVNGTPGLTQPGQLAGHAKLKSHLNTYCFVLILSRTNIVFFVVVFLGGRWGAGEDSLCMFFLCFICLVFV